MSVLASYLTVVALLLFGLSPLLMVVMFHSVHTVRRKLLKIA